MNETTRSQLYKRTLPKASGQIEDGGGTTGVPPTIFLTSLAWHF
jgi:hypothetical protein